MTNSLLVLTAPRFRKEEDEKAKLSGYILDENSNENSFDQQQETSSLIQSLTFLKIDIAHLASTSQVKL